VSPFEAHLPHPLREDVPHLLSTGRMRAPPVRVLLLVFIGEDRLKTAPAQLLVQYISRSEGVLGSGGEEKRIDHTVLRSAHPSSNRSRRMGGDTDSRSWSSRGEGHLGTIEEGQACFRFRMPDRVICWLGKTSLHVRKIKQIIVLPTDDRGQSAFVQINHHRPITLLPISS
jgi:hypothetical protein